MKNMHLVALGAILAVAAVACGAETDTTVSGSQASSGLANPAAVHCESQGYRLEGEQCVFPDGSSCEQWTFFNGACAPKPPVEPDAGPSPDAAPNPTPIPACAPIPVTPGTANPASIHCIDMGYTLDMVQTPGGESAQCVFPDGTRCDQWAFWRGQCGQTHSFCNLHGGTVSSEEVGTGTWAMCTLPSGAKCQEQTFVHSCVCE